LVLDYKIYVFGVHSMGLFNFFKNKAKNSQKSPKLNYSINGNSLSIGDFTGEYHQSPNGKFILAWKDQNENGKYILLERGKVKLQAKMRRPNNGMVSNSGVFILSDLTSKGTYGLFHIINAEGETLIKQRCKANLGPTGISDDGNFAVCQALESTNKSDSCKLYFFDIKNKKLLWNKLPETIGSELSWPESYRFDTKKKVLYLRYDKNRIYRYTFEGTFIDSKSYRYDCINTGNDIEFLEAVKELKEELSTNTDPREYDALIAPLTKGLKRFSDKDAKSKIHRVLGEILHLQGNDAEAIKHFETALKINPRIGVKRTLEKLKKID
jgi:tetratricopeptide (TPR) repeat protein